MDDVKTWTMNDDSRASNPGGVPVSKLRWMSHYPVWATLWTLPVVVIAALVVIVGEPLLVLVSLPFCAMLFLYWKRVKEHFAYGCKNPAFVVSVEPTLIAASTDLSKGFGEFPVIKIFPAPLKKIRGEPVRVGQRVATVALYSPGAEALPHWVDFDPRPVDCACADLETQKRAIASIEPSDWEELKEWLRSLPKPYSVGTYPIGWRPKQLVGWHRTR